MESLRERAVQAYKVAVGKDEEEKQRKEAEQKELALKKFEQWMQHLGIYGDTRHYSINKHGAPWVGAYVDNIHFSLFAAEKSTNHSIHIRVPCSRCDEVCGYDIGWNDALITIGNILSNPCGACNGSKK